MFKQRMNIISRELMKAEYKDKLNVENIVSIYGFKINKILKNESKEEAEAFKLYLISKWILLQEDIDADKIKKLKHLIRKCKIKLTDEDLYELTLLEERSFSSYRHIKILNVSNELQSKEQVGVKYVKAQLYEKTERLTLLLEGDLLISNKRIIFENTNSDDISFNWSDIKSYTFAHYGFDFKINKNYVIRIHDQITLNNTLRNMISKKVKYIISKEV